ncbi:unnamed protein product [Staurois parvus]|uniref:Uncharacterized protein n=1 Tax=Staurois parvus TaxID=386267 RepID=A0ABN9ECW4_9NEOB|nr:unnamed protein product [Staurois parvus]
MLSTVSIAIEVFSLWQGALNAGSGGRPDIVNAGSRETGYSECRVRGEIGYSECRVRGDQI